MRQDCGPADGGPGVSPRLISRKRFQSVDRCRTVPWETAVQLRLILLICSCVFVLFPAVQAYGQSSTYARLVGTVKDQSDAVLPGVEVTATSKATNIPTLAVTNDRGDYLIDKLIPGLYDVRAELPGFKTQLSVDIRLEVTQVARVDVVMTPGEISEQVTVVGQSTIIDTDTVENASVVEEKKIQDLPIQGRNLVKLAYLATGGNLPGRGGASTPAENANDYGGGYPAFNGLYNHANQITLDGSNNQGYITQRPAVQPTPETIQEFKVITSNYSAEYGRVGGAVISMLSKSGSNEFHGHGWYYFRDEAFDAANFFVNKTGREILPVNYQVFGGSVGGPIVKDRTFFHAHYERFVDDLERVAFATVPSAAVRSGDFQGAGASGPIPQLYNPFNVVEGERVPFTGNQIPQNLWHPIYRKVLEIAPPPEPNVAGASSRNYSYPETRNSRVNKYSIRGDHHLADGDTLFGRFSWQNSPETRHDNRIGLPGESLHGIGRTFADQSHGWQTALGWVNPVGSNLVTEFNASIWRFLWLFSRPLHQTNFAQELGYAAADRHPVFYPDGSRGPGNMPGIFFGNSNYTGWGGNGTSPLSDWGLGLKLTSSWRKGNHYFKFGFEHTRNLDVKFNFVGAYSNGGDLFNGFAAGQIQRDAEGSITGSSFGEPWADLMLGLPASTFGNVLGHAGSFAHANQSHYSWFVNDDWKLGPNLSLNLGLRWEQPRPPYYEGTPDANFSTDYYYCAFDYSPGEQPDRPGADDAAGFRHRPVSGTHRAGRSLRESTSTGLL